VATSRANRDRLIGRTDDPDRSFLGLFKKSPSNFREIAPAIHPSLPEDLAKRLSIFA
jgi:hypothetical protein